MIDDYILRFLIALKFSASNRLCYILIHNISFKPENNLEKKVFYPHFTNVKIRVREVEGHSPTHTV